MKKSKLLFIGLLTSLFIGCTPLAPSGGFLNSDIFNNSQTSSENSSSSFTESSSSNVSESTSTTTITELPSISSEIESSVSSTSSNSSIAENRTIEIYAINDFHGATEPSGYEGGLLKVGSFLKEKGKQENTLLLNSGDMWQGSIHSNYNYGKMLTDVMNDIEFDCFTLGNHEFDWGQEYIINNRTRKGSSGNDENGYQTPFLAANIYKYDISTKTTLEYASLGEKYVIRELENGLKVGIIGVIGKDQITSISSQFVDDVTFVDPVPVVKELSDELRIEQGCDVVIVDAHTDQYSITESSESSFADNAGLTSISEVSNERYVDAVFCAHTHEEFNQTLNGVPFVQAQCNGKAYNYVSLNVDKNGDVTCIESNCTYASNITEYEVDESIQSIYQSYKTQSDLVGSEVLGTLDNTLYYYSTNETNLANLVTTAIASYAKTSGYDIDYAVTNVARSDLSSGDITYEKLFKSLPFDNVVYIAKVSGFNLSYNLKKSSNFMYRVDTSAISNSQSVYYTVAIIDYLLLHRNSSRDYNYFTDIEILGKLEKTGYEIYNYRDITADYIREQGSLTASNYLSTNDKYNTSLITSSI